MAIIKDQEQNTRMVRSRIQLLMKAPFFGTLLLHMPIEETYEIQTCATEGKKLYYNPDFTKTVSDAELNFILMHEILHAALGHIWRRGNREHQKFNFAADYAVNAIIHEMECSDIRMPKGCLYDPKFANKSSEEIYDLLPDQPQMKQNGNGQGHGKSTNKNGKNQSQGQGQGQGQTPQQQGRSIDDHSMWDNAEAQKDKDKQQREWSERMINAAEVAEAKARGTVPGYLKRLIGSLTKPQKNWKQLLAEFVEHEVYDYGFCPPDRRLYSVTDVFLPSFNEETDLVKDFIFVIDTSGSIHDKELTVFYSEIVGCIQQFGSLRGHLLFCDTEVAAEYEIEDVSDILAAKPAGGGGTRMEAAVEYTMKKQESGEWDVSGMAILTDCWDGYNLKEGEVPFKTLWLSTTERKGPSYGTTVPFKVE